MHKVLLSIEDLHTNDAGPKARTDIEKILGKEDYDIWDLPFNYESKLKKFKYMYWNIPRLFKGQQIDEIYFQFPAYSTVLMDALIKSIRTTTNAKLIFIIHDIESLRRFQTNEYAKNEAKWLNEADGLIVHSQAMKDYLISHQVETPMVILGVFDYLNPQLLQIQKPYRRSICFAGNLVKSTFLKKVDFKGKMQLEVFGLNPLEAFPSDVSYRGVYSPEELPKHLEANFGLVWDGSRTDTCDGSYGEYMQYNCPHKVSLYLSTGLPIVIWKKAAVAKYLVDNGLGIAVDSLDELPNRLSQLPLEEYEQMKARVQKVAEGLRNGKQIKTAIKKINELI